MLFVRWFCFNSQNKSQRSGVVTDAEDLGESISVLYEFLFQTDKGSNYLMYSSSFYAVLYGIAKAIVSGRIVT